MAKEFDLNFLGRIPMDPRVVMGGDDGDPYLSSGAESPAVDAFSTLVDSVLDNSTTATPINLNSSGSCGCGDVGGCGDDEVHGGDSSGFSGGGASGGW